MLCCPFSVEELVFLLRANQCAGDLSLYAGLPATMNHLYLKLSLPCSAHSPDAADLKCIGWRLLAQPHQTHSNFRAFLSPLKNLTKDQWHHSHSVFPPSCQPLIHSVSMKLFQRLHRNELYIVWTLASAFLPLACCCQDCQPTVPLFLGCWQCGVLAQAAVNSAAVSCYLQASLWRATFILLDIQQRMPQGTTRNCCQSVLISFTGLLDTKLELSGEKESPLRNCIDHIRLWTCLQGIRLACEHVCGGTVLVAN